MANEFEYRRLPGKLVGVVRKASLWEGKDHVLSVSGTRFVENYRRFFYRDIQAIIVRRCVRFGSLGAWLLTAFASAILLVWLRSSVLVLPARIVLGVLVGLCIYRLIVAFRFSCRCYIQTAVSREELPSLMRSWNVEPALERIRAHIREEQGMLPDAFRMSASPAEDEPRAAASVSALPPAQENNAGEPYSQAVNLALAGFVLCLVDAAASMYLFDGPTPETAGTRVQVCNACLTLLQGTFVLIALIKVHRRRALRSLRNFLVAALCFTGLEIYVGNFLSSLSNTRNGTTNIRVDMLSLWHNIVRADAGVALVIGFGGLILIFLNWGNFRRGGLSAA